MDDGLSASDFQWVIENWRDKDYRTISQVIAA
jgi:hypothetical protein